MTMQEDRSSWGAREEDIDRVERGVGARFPEWLRDRLLRENGFELDDSAGITGRSWRILPVLDRSDRRRQAATADDMLRNTIRARAIDRVSSPGFGEPVPGAPFPPDAVVIGRGWIPDERLALRLDPDSPNVFGTALYRQTQFAPMEDLGVDLEAFAPDPISFDTGEPLPAFRYHPDPVGSGAIMRSGKVCARCGRQRGWVLAQTQDPLCPWCLAKTPVDDAGDAWGVDFDEDIPAAAAREISQRTPGFTTWQDTRWLGHCGDAAAFEGSAGWDRLEHLAGARAALLDDGWPENIIRMMRPDGDVVAYLFRCLHCGADLAYADAS